MIILDDSNKSVTNGMVKLDADNQELVIPSIKHIGNRQSTNLEGAKITSKNISIAKIGLGANKTGENKIGKSIAIKNEARRLDAIATKSLEVLIEGLRGLYVTIKSLKVSIGGLRWLLRI